MSNLVSLCLLKIEIVRNKMNIEGGKLILNYYRICYDLFECTNLLNFLCLLSCLCGK